MTHRTRALLLIIVICLTTFVFFCACKNVEPVMSDSFVYGHYNKEYSVNDTEIIPIVRAYAFQSDKRAAFGYLIDTVKNNLRSMPTAARIATASGRSVTGKMGYVAFEAGNLFLMQANSWYYQSLTKAVSAKPDLLLPLLRPTLDRAERYYTEDGNEIIMKKGTKKSKISLQNNFPYINCDFSKAEKKTVNISDVINYKEEFINICAYNLCADTVLLNTFAVTEHVGYCKIEFELNLSDEAARAKAVSAQRDYMRKVTGMNNMEYDEIKIVLEVWNNGLPKKIIVCDRWSGKFKILLTELVIGSETESTYYYSYHPDDADYKNINLEWAY